MPNDAEYIANANRLALKAGDPLFRRFFAVVQYGNDWGSYPDTPLTYQEAVSGVTAVILDQYVWAEQGDGGSTTFEEEVFYYSEWRRVLKDECSAKYRDLQSQLVEGLDRSALNRNRDLELLNAVRLGIGIKINQMHCERNRRESRSQKMKSVP